MSRAFGASALSGVHVLVVEDDEDARAMYQSLFELCGAVVATASSGNSGWQLFEAQRPDILISDIQMLDGNGYDLVRRVRGLSADRGGLTPAIAVSAADNPELSLDAGFHAHVVKPPDPLMLIDLVRSFVTEGTGTRATWTLTGADPFAVLTFVGHPTADDMRNATRALAKILEAHRRHVVVDLRQITGFDLSVGNVAERTVWDVRRHITGATIVGGSFLARLVSRAACTALGVTCEFADTWPAASHATA